MLKRVSKTIIKTQIQQNRNYIFKNVVKNKPHQRYKKNSMHTSQLNISH